MFGEKFYSMDGAIKIFVHNNDHHIHVEVIDVLKSFTILDWHLSPDSNFVHQYSYGGMVYNTYITPRQLKSTLKKLGFEPAYIKAIMALLKSSKFAPEGTRFFENYTEPFPVECFRKICGVEVPTKFLGKIVFDGKEYNVFASSVLALSAYWRLEPTGGGKAIIIDPLHHPDLKPIK